MSLAAARQAYIVAMQSLTEAERIEEVVAKLLPALDLRYPDFVQSMTLRRV